VGAERRCASSKKGDGGIVKRRRAVGISAAVAAAAAIAAIGLSTMWGINPIGEIDPLTGPGFAATVLGGWTKVDIDTDQWGDVKVWCDINNDGWLDVVSGGAYDGTAIYRHELCWYENLQNGTIDSTQHIIEGTDWSQFTNDIDCADIDDDGDMDLFAPDEQDVGDGPGAFDPGWMHWFENPCDGSSGCTQPETEGNWNRYRVGVQVTVGNRHIKDVTAGDFDNDGKLDVFGRVEDDDARLYFQDTLPSTWTQIEIADDTFGGERYIGGPGEGGIAWDMDGDGDLDLIGCAMIAENPCCSIALPCGASGTGCTGALDPRDPADWSDHIIGDTLNINTPDFRDFPGGFKVAAADLDDDGDLDIVYTNSEGQDAIWIFENPGSLSDDWVFNIPLVSWGHASVGPGTGTPDEMCPYAAHSLYVADFSIPRDNKLDIYIGGFGERTPEAWSPGNLTDTTLDGAQWILENINGFGIESPDDDEGDAFDTYVIDIDNDQVHNSAFADFDQDGDLDFISASSEEKPPPTLSVWVNNENPVGGGGAGGAGGAGGVAGTGGAGGVAGTGGAPVSDSDLVTFQMTPLTADTTTVADTVECAMELTDSDGIVNAVCLLEAATLGYQTSCIASSPSSGTAADGTWTCTLPFKALSKQGDWNVVYVHANDTLGNGTKFTNADMIAGIPDIIPDAAALIVAVTSPSEDTVVPSISLFNVAPSPVPVGDAVHCTVTATDTGSGIQDIGATFTSADGVLSCIAHTGLVCDILIPTGADAGVTWNEANHFARDNIGNLNLIEGSASFVTTIADTGTIDVDMDSLPAECTGASWDINTGTYTGSTTVSIPAAPTGDYTIVWLDTAIGCSNPSPDGPKTLTSGSTIDFTLN
jgi:hypothetical protein